jgi:hypothetical protein
MREHNHALDALRYLVHRLDMGRRRPGRGEEALPEPETPGAVERRRPWSRLDNDELWTPMGW